MKKTVLKGLGVAVLAGGIFVAGGITGSANTEWYTEIILNNNAELSGYTEEEKQRLLANMDTDIKALVEEKLAGTLSEKKAAIVAALEAEYNTNLENITNTTGYQEILASLDRLATASTERAVTDISAAFDEVIVTVE